MGGLLLWRSPQNFVRLDWGGLGPGEVSCLGCLNGYETFWGRGRTQCQQLFLRIERNGNQIRALFSEDANHWRLVGEAIFPMDDDSNEHVGDQDSGPNSATDWEAGLFALGAINRTLYPQAPAGGAAACFREIQLTANLNKHPSS